MKDEQPLSFVGTTSSDSETTEKHEFDHDGTLTRVKTVTHRGQQYALQQSAFLVRDGSKTSLWKGLDKEFIAGNGQVFDLPIRFEFSEGDELVFQAKNINQEGHQYHHNMTVNVDQETGAFERLANRIRRVL